MTRAIPAERGCGTRVDGGLYLEVGLSPNGRPLEHFLIDPADELPDGYTAKDFANKVVLFPVNGVHHIVSWIGAKHYPHLFDFLEEVRSFGVSRRIPRTLRFDLITDESRLLIIHPRAINDAWREHAPPDECGKGVPGHVDHEAGPCLWQTLHLIPKSDGTPIHDGWYRRTNGSTHYSYRPTDETATLRPGIVAVFRPTGLCVVRRKPTPATDDALTRMRRTKAATIEIFETEQ